jgi:hypothetical protein
MPVFKYGRLRRNPFKSLSLHEFFGLEVTVALHSKGHQRFEGKYANGDGARPARPGDVPGAGDDAAGPIRHAGLLSASVRPSVWPAGPSSAATIGIGEAAPSGEIGCCASCSMIHALSTIQLQALYSATLSAIMYVCRPCAHCNNWAVLFDFR